MGESWLRRSALVAAMVAAAVLLVAVDAAAATTPGAEPTPDYRDDSSYTAVAVAMKDNDFVPQTVTVDPGTVVRWDNEGRVKHNVIPDRAKTGWKSSTIKPGRAFEHKLEHPGVYGYFCSFHGAPGGGMD